ncbi:hypothetical protein [Pectinatus frisingensis]|uniref:hypothetical protein n=1 Tax=Pectinatus frisingensis TaxID=865 RepID=UPI0018C6B542|nr:hypothetical protein [Pectinatus frisingensis]
MDNYCTLFDSNYLIKGLTMYRSLVATDIDLHLYILAIDKKCANILRKLQLSNATIIDMNEFETLQLRKIKKERNNAEYCWTCTPFIIGYVLEHYSINEVTYLDADLYFFSKPSILLNEFHESMADVLLVEHRYEKKFNNLKLKAFGKFCVQFMTFKNNKNGTYILKWWQERCIEWCFAHLEKGKFGDQRYLDNWETLFDGVYSLKNIGGGVALWNINQYICELGPMINKTKIIFYHFHHFKWKSKNSYCIGGKVCSTAVKYIYNPYFNEMKNSFFLVKKVDKTFKKNFEIDKDMLFDYLWKRMERTIDKVWLSKTLFNIIRSHKKIFLWGAGQHGTEFHFWLLKYGIKIDGYIDSNQNRMGKTLYNIKIYSNDILTDKNIFIIVTPDNYYDSIYNQLKFNGYIKCKDYMHLQTLKRKIITQYSKELMSKIFIK